MEKSLDSSGRSDEPRGPMMISKIYAVAMEIQKGCKRKSSFNYFRAATFLVIYLEATDAPEAAKKAKLRIGIDGFIAWESDPGNSAERELELLSYVTDMLGATVLVRSKAAEVATEVLFLFRLSNTNLQMSDAFHTKAIETIVANTASIVFDNAEIRIPPRP